MKILVSIVLFLIYSINIVAQTGEKRLALVIGNGNYMNSTLANPENDARAMRDALQKVGFEVLEYENLNQSQMKKAIDNFGEMLKGIDVALFYYAGHGIQSKGNNYLIPVDVVLKSEEYVEYDCVQADRVLAAMDLSGSKIKFIILDACRDNPFEKSWTRSLNSKGLAFMNAPRGSLIAYATSPGKTASDGGGNNGLYTSAILENIATPNISILQMFQNVRDIVSKKSDGQQLPWELTSLVGDFYFIKDARTPLTSKVNRSFGNEWQVSNVDFMYKEETKFLSISYNLTGCASEDFYNIRLIMTTIKGDTLKPKYIGGDIGTYIKCGLDKTIIWDLGRDNISIKDKMRATVMASKITSKQ